MVSVLTLLLSSNKLRESLIRSFWFSDFYFRIVFRTRTWSTCKILFLGRWLLIVFHYLLFKRVLHINSHLLSSRLITRAQNRSSSEQTISSNLSALFGQTIKENGKMQMISSIIMIDNTKVCRLCLSQRKDNGSTIPAEEMKSWLARLKVDVCSA